MDTSSLITILTLIIGFLSGCTMVCLKLIFKSKCSDVNLCCNFIRIKRDINNEIKAEQMELQNMNNENNTERRSKLDRSATLRDINMVV